jgi:hypothetical protein
MAAVFEATVMAATSIERASLKIIDAKTPTFFIPPPSPI